MKKRISILYIFLYLTAMQGTIIPQYKTIWEKADTYFPNKGGYLGLYVSDINNDNEGYWGVKILQILEDSPASKVDLKLNDEILEINDIKMQNLDEIMKFWDTTSGNEKLRIKIKRILVEKIIEVELQPLGKEAMMGSTRDLPSGKLSKYGLFCFNMGEQLSREFNVPQKSALMIEKIAIKSPAEDAGFHAGDIIIGIDEEIITYSNQLESFLNNRFENDLVEFKILRNCKPITIKAQLDNNFVNLDAKVSKMMQDNKKGLSPLKNQNANSMSKEFNSKINMNSAQEVTINTRYLKI